MDPTFTPGSSRPPRLFRALLDLLLPPRCVACDERLPVGAAPVAFCAVCDASLHPDDEPDGGNPPARRIENLTGGAHVVVRAGDLAAHAPYQYGGALATALMRLKHGDAAHVAAPLGAALGAWLGRLAAAADDPLLVVPVPLHRRRLVRRGYNQALLLARAALRALADGRAAAAARPVTARVVVAPTALVRTRDTPPQGGLSRAARQRNVRGAFRAHATRVRDRRVVLVDDVITTGATASACARALRRCGARRIDVLALARADLQR